MAEVAETTYKGRRLIVRRTRLDRRPGELWPDWRHFGFLTDLDGDAVELDAFHRDHARVELAIKDLKEGAGMEHFPSGHFSANSAWLCCAVLAHDLVRWCALLGGIVDEDKLTVTRTLRTRYFSVPARLVNRSGRPTLRAPHAGPGRRIRTSAHQLRPSPSSPPEQPWRTGVAADDHRRADNRDNARTSGADAWVRTDHHRDTTSAASDAAHSHRGQAVDRG